MLHLSVWLDLYIGCLAFVLGACAGSFLNCAAWRAVHGESVLKGRSHCDVCGQPLSARDLVPIVSFLAHGGRCRMCGAKLSAGHVAAEALTGLVFVLLAFTFDLTLPCLEAVIFCCVLLACAFADLAGYIIPDRFLLVGLLLRIPFFFLLPDAAGNLIDAALGGFAVGGGLLLLVLVYEKVRKIEAMGGGDLKLLFLTGLYLGWVKNLLCLLFSCLLGILFALLTQKRRQNQENAKIFPWGPSIAAAAMLALLFGDSLIGMYLSLF